MKKFKNKFLALSLTFSLFVPNLSVLAVADQNLGQDTEKMEAAVNTAFTNDDRVLVTEASTEETVLGETPSSSEIVVSLKEGTLYEHKATLTLKDKDGCIFEDQTPKLYLIKDDIVINTYDLSVGENEIDLGMDLDPEQQYKLDVRASYNIGNGINKRDITLKSYKFQSLSVVPGEIDVVGLKVMNADGEEKEYYSMREKVTAEISINDPKVKADKVSLGGELVPAKTVEGKIVFEVTVPDHGETSYEKSIDFLLMGEKEIKLRGEDEHKKVSFNIEKNDPQVLSIGTKKVGDKLNTEIKIEDADTALSKVAVKFYKEENGEYVPVSEVVENGSVENITTDFDLTEDIVNYKIDVLFSADRGHEEYTDKVVSEKEIHITTESLDLKDISEVKLYYQGEAVEVLNIANGLPQGEALKDYYLEIQPVYASKLYANVKEFKQTDGKVYAVADLKEFLSFKKDSAGLQAENTVAFEIAAEAGDASQGMKSADELIQKIKANLGGTHELTEDLDASKLSTTDAVYITGNFTGTLNGNGYTIYGLNKPLFNNISGGKVENIKFKDASVSINDAKAVLAKEISNQGTVDEVTFEDSTLTTTTNSVGMVCGNLKNSKVLNTKILNCSVSGSNTIGGIAGEVGSGSTVEGCLVYNTFVKGTMAHNSLGSRVGGITGWLNAAGSIKNTYTNVSIESNGNAGAGGLIGGPQTDGGVIENVIAISTGNGQQIAGFDAALNRITNVYQLADASNKNTANGLQTVDAVTRDFLVNQIKLTDEHWKILDASNTLLGAGSNLKHVSTYQKENDQRYMNVMKIAPFLSTESVVQMGNFLTNENLKNKAVSAVYPFDASGNFVEYLESGQDSSIKQIKVAYSDNTFDIFNVSYDRTADDIVAIYNIDGDSIPYHFDKYISKDELGIATYIQEKADALDYDTEIKTTIGEENIRLYKEIYEKEIKSELSKVAEILVGTRYNYTINNNDLGDRIKAEIDAELAKLLYNYTYFRKSYDFKIGGINIANLLTFHAEKLNSAFTFDYLHNQLKAGSRAMNQTYEKYRTMIQSKTGTELYQQLEFFIRMSGTEDYNQWFLDNWKGHVAEQDPVGYDYTPLLNWRIWDNLTNLYGVDAHLLHILTIPEEIQPQMGIISTSSQLVFSEVSIYYADPESESNLEKFYQKVDNCAARYGRYYGTPLGFVENGEENLNADLCIGYDTIGKYVNPAYSDKQGYGTEAPLVKYMMEPRQVMYNDTSKGAVANGKYIFYGYMHALSDDLGIFTHENAHNQDSDFFYAKAGRRPGAHGEYHAEGMLTQNAAVSTWNGTFNFNSMYNFNIEDNVIANLSYERINTREKIHDFYRDLFEVWYVANAMYGEAFIEAPESVKENVNKKITITGEASFGTQYGTGYWSDAMADWELNDLTDLFNYNIAVRPIENASSTGYHIELFWPVMWYTPTNPNGAADPGTFKIIAYDMLGYAGWDKGLVEWVSARHQNDNEAIKAITGYDTVMDYRKARITEAAEKAKTSPYFHSEQIEKVIGAAYATEDRKSIDNTLGVKKILTHAIKRVTDDFTNGTVYEESTNVYKVGTAEEFIAAVEDTCDTTGIMIKLTNDIDFSGVEVSGNAYMNRIFGFIEGNGYKISGLKKPLFDKMMYTMVSNVELEGDSNILLANTSSFSLVHHSYYDTTKTLINSGNTQQNVYTYFIGKELIGEGTTLDTPENFKAEAGNGQVTLSWTAPAGKVTKYQVSKDNGSTWTDVTNGTSYIYTDLTNGTTYQFKVRAVNAVGEGRVASVSATPMESAAVQTVETPVFSPNGGTFTEAQTVTISSATAGASIYYTTDGSDPDTGSTRYSQPITVNETTTIKAIAVKADMNNSTVASAAFTINQASDQQEKVNNPVISPNGGTYTQAQKVSIISETADAKIYYTLDGTAPTDKSTLYSGEITIDETTTIKAIAIKDGMTDSDVVEARFTISKDSGQKEKVADPVISPNGGTYTQAQKVSIISETADAKIYYTLDGTAPTDKSPLYSREITIDETTTIKAIAIKDGMTDSDVVEAGFTISKDSGQKEKVADPAISPNGGTYDKAQNITITSATSGAKIYYTTDGSTPTEKSNLYSKPFAVSETTIIKAIAVKDGMTNSKVTIINYVIEDSVVKADKPWIFTDVAQDNGWKHLSVKYVYNNDIMGAITGTTLFQPDRQLERGMFATMLYRMAGSPKVTYKEKFSDVPAGKWYSDAIIWANENKIVDGYTDGSFGVTDFITREQIAKMLYEYATRVMKYDTNDRKDLNSFTDAKDVSNWATTYMQWVTAVEMITGKPNGDKTYRMDPKGLATRAECAAMLERFAKKYE